MIGAAMVAAKQKDTAKQGAKPGARKTAPFPPDLLANIEAMAEAHRRLPRPPQAGHVIGIPRPK